MDKKNKVHEAVIFKYKRCEKCPFKCSQKIDKVKAEKIHDEFWKLCDDAKFNFYDKTTKKLPKKRVRKNNENSEKPRTFSFSYYFSVYGTDIRVCREFYLSTLSISSRRIHYFHKNKKTGITSTPQRDQRGKKTGQKISIESRNVVRQHINSFPTVASHYCRKNSKKKYLEFGLNLSKMFELYVEYCHEINELPVKFWLYNKIFNEEFNLSFFKPKKDQCDLCCEYANQVSQNTVSEVLETKYNTHVNEKNAARLEKSKDKAENQEKKKLIAFDLQRVLNIPQTNVSKAYYLQKLNVYNLTACDITEKQGYCILWDECLSGRSGNDIASAVVQFLKQLLQNKQNVTELVMWSDSCVPQNKNSIMTLALLDFLNRNDHKVVKIEQKFQEPGHSCVQEVDSIHSAIDRKFEKEELHSLLAVIKKFRLMRTRKPYTVYRMKKTDFKDYKSVSAKFVNFKDIPYSKIKNIIYTKKSNKITYRTTLASEDFQEVYLKLKDVDQPVKNTRARKNSRVIEAKKEEVINFPEIPILLSKSTLPKEKETAIRSLFPQFSANDVHFWETVFSEAGRK